MTKVKPKSRSVPFQATCSVPSSPTGSRLSRPTPTLLCPVLYRASEGIRWPQERPRATTKFDSLRRDSIRHSLFSSIAGARASTLVVSRLFTRSIRKQMPHSLPTNHYCRHKTSISIVLRFLSLQLSVQIFSLICTADLNAQQHKNIIYYLSVYSFIW